jgi:hypothetical protein
MKANIYQIYYNDETKAKLEPSYIPYFNESCTVYFENSVIRRLIEEGKHKDCDFFGVVSHKLKDKLGSHISNVNRGRGGFVASEFNEFARQNKGADLICFNRFTVHDPIKLAERYHPKFSQIMRQLLDKIGFQVNFKPIVGVYFNHFIATSSFWDAYTSELLFPFMDALKDDPNAFQDSGYQSKFPMHLQEEHGITHYPYHPFLCERLPAVFLMKYQGLRVRGWK